MTCTALEPAPFALSARPARVRRAVGPTAGSATRTADVHPAAPAARRGSGTAGVRTSTAGLRLTTRGRAVVVALAVAVAGGVALSAESAVAGAPATPVAVETRTIAAGDTLWAIAAGLADPHEDVRDVVDAIAALNGLDGSALQAGQQILVPVE